MPTLGPARTASLLSFVLLLACGPEREVLPPEVLAHSFAGSEWSEPVHIDAPVNSPARELGAELSPDELSLYFGSDRAGGLGAFDIWVSRRACLECPWETPANLGPNINSPGGDGAPTLSADGHLLFFSGSRAGGKGGEDIWVSRRTDTNDDLGWAQAVNLGPDVNTAVNEGGPAYVAALAGGGANLYFGRGATLADNDIYQVRVTREGETLGPATPVAELNSSLLDGKPAIRADGREVFFWSTRAPAGWGRISGWPLGRAPTARGRLHGPWGRP